MFASKNTFKFHPIDEYEIDKLTDPQAKASPVMNRSRYGQIKHDGDMWFETILCNVKTGDLRTYFVSQNGKRRRDEPPTGASAVVYLKYEARIVRLSKK